MSGALWDATKPGGLRGAPHGDRVTHGRHAAGGGDDQEHRPRLRTQPRGPAVLVADIRAGLANGSMVRGTTTRTATGRAMTPVQGDILLPHQVTAVTPTLGRGRPQSRGRSSDSRRWTRVAGGRRWWGYGRGDAREL